MEQAIGLLIETIFVGLCVAFLFVGIWEGAAFVFGFDLMTWRQTAVTFVLCPSAVGIALITDWLIEWNGNRKR